MSKLTIIELCLSPDLGGLELYMINTAKILKNEFNVISVINKDSKIAKYYDETDSYIELNKTSSFFIFSEAKKLAKLIDKKGVDIIHLHWTKDIPFVVLAKLLSKSKPKIVQTRHMTMTRFKDDFYHKFLYKNIDLILAVTQQVKEQLERFIPLGARPEIELLYAGVKNSEILSDVEVDKLKQEFNFKKNCFNVGMVGRINEPKGQYLLIEAISILREKGVEVDGFFVGNPMEESYLEKLKGIVKDKNLEDNIKFLGFMKNPHNFYKMCDVIVLASKRETFGLVLVEAINSKTAVIGSNSGGVVEIIEDKKTGLLFDVEDSKSLADKIEFMMNNPELKESMEKLALKKSYELFNEEKQFSKLKTIFKRLI